MAAHDPTKVLQVPTRLVVGPTQGGLTAGSYPYGSTVLGGFTRGAFLDHQQASGPILDRAIGSVISAWWGSELWWIGFDLEQYDPDIYGLLLRSDGSGGFRGGPTIGIKAPSSAILLAAYDAQYPCVLAPAPIPATKQQRFDFQARNRRLAPRFLFLCAQNSSGHEVQINTIPNLTVP
jgi:hypothetical protein